MSNVYLKKISNSFQDVRLVSLASWRQASEINPRDRNGPYIVTQEAYDPNDLKMTGDEFVLGKSGHWLSLACFFKMSVPDRREEFVFGTAAEVMQLMANLPSEPLVLRPGPGTTETPNVPEDEMAAALKARGNQGAGAP